MMTRIRLTQAMLLLAVCTIVAAGQISAQDTATQPTRLALEVTFYPGRAPGYQAVKTSAEGGAYALFARIDARNNIDNAEFRAVHVASYLERDAAHVIISLLSGKKGA
jgi:hypothetical protein